MNGFLTTTARGALGKRFQNHEYSTVHHEGENAFMKEKIADFGKKCWGAPYEKGWKRTKNGTFVYEGGLAPTKCETGVLWSSENVKGRVVYGQVSGLKVLWSGNGAPKRERWNA